MAKTGTFISVAEDQEGKNPRIVTPYFPLPVAMGDSPSIDAFARLRVSNPATIFDSQLQYDKHPLLWDEWGDGTATHNANESCVDMAVTSGQSIRRQTFQYHRYQPGKSQLIFCTGAFANCDTLRMVKRSSVTGSPIDTAIDQDKWNIDTLEEFDFEKSVIFYADIEYLGVGRVRTGIVPDGIPVVGNQFLHAGKESTTYMSTANLPLRYELVSNGVSTFKRMGYFDDENGIFLEAEVASASSSMKHICSTVMSEGGQSFEQAFIFSAETALLTAGAAEAPLLAIRPKTLFNSMVNRGNIQPMHYHLGVLTNDLVFRVYYDPVITGGAWVSADANSITEYNVTATSFTGGINTDSDYILGGKKSGGQSSSSNENSKFPITLDHAGANPKAMLLTAQRIGNADSTVYASTQWREIR